MVLTVNTGLLISSIIYRMRREGRAIMIRITAGRIVHMVSTSCEYIELVCVRFVVHIREMI